MTTLRPISQQLQVALKGGPRAIEAFAKRLGKTPEELLSGFTPLQDIPLPREFDMKTEDGMNFFRVSNKIPLLPGREFKINGTIGDPTTALKGSIVPQNYSIKVSPDGDSVILTGQKINLLKDPKKEGYGWGYALNSNKGAISDISPEAKTLLPTNKFFGLFANIHEQP